MPEAACIGSVLTPAQILVMIIIFMVCIGCPPCNLLTYGSLTGPGKKTAQHVAGNIKYASATDIAMCVSHNYG